jgi:hypothetical protein
MQDAKKIIKYFKSHHIPAAILKCHQIASYEHPQSLKYPVRTRWGSAATSLNSLASNQLALDLARVELIRRSDTNIPDTICDTIKSEDFWRDVDSLLVVLDQLVARITKFESDTPRLALFYEWYHKQLESNSKYLILLLYIHLFLYIIIYFEF